MTILLRRATLALPVLLIALPGCAALDAPTRGPARGTRAVVVHAPGSARTAPLPSRVVRDTRADAGRYADRLDRALRLDRRQERAVRDLVTDRALDFLARQHPRDRRALYPFPRQSAERTRAGARWWSATDQRIERVLTKQQRRAYRDVVRYGAVRQGREGYGDDRPRGQHPGRGHGRHKGDDRRGD